MTTGTNLAPDAGRIDADEPSGLPTMYRPVLSTKTFGHDLGFSCAFRQWKAHSHCNKVHGYALGFKFVFAATKRDECGWVVDFGGLKPLKQILADTFDHRLLVATDDPMIEQFREMHLHKMADVVEVPATGCEAFATMVYDVTSQWLADAGFSPRVWLVSVEVSEHGANSAIAQG